MLSLEYFISLLELNFRCALCGIIGFKLWLGCEAEPSGIYHGWEFLYGCIVSCHSLGVTSAGSCYTVLGAFELHLEITEILVCLKIGICLSDSKK